MIKFKTSFKSSRFLNRYQARFSIDLIIYTFPIFSQLNKLHHRIPSTQQLQQDLRKETIYIYIMYGKKVRSSLYPLGSGEPPPGAKALLFFLKKASVL